MARGGTKGIPDLVGTGEDNNSYKDTQCQLPSGFSGSVVFLRDKELQRKCECHPWGLSRTLAPGRNVNGIASVRATLGASLTHLRHERLKATLPVAKHIVRPACILHAGNGRMRNQSMMRMKALSQKHHDQGDARCTMQSLCNGRGGGGGIECFFSIWTCQRP